MRKILSLAILAMLCVSSVYSDQNYTIHVAGMHCPLCTSMVRKALLQVDGVKSAKASLKDNNAVVVADDNVTKSSLLDAIKTTGYTGEFVE